MDFAEFRSGPGAWGFVDRALFTSPLFRAVQDLEFRIGIRCQMVGPSPGDDVEADPLRDGSLSVVDVAERKGVSVRAVHKAIARGDLVAHGRPASISERSAEAWAISHGRQRSGRTPRAVPALHV